NDYPTCAESDFQRAGMIRPPQRWIPHGSDRQSSELSFNVLARVGATPDSGLRRLSKRPITDARKKIQNLEILPRQNRFGSLRHQKSSFSKLFLTHRYYC